MISGSREHQRGRAIQLARPRIAVGADRVRQPLAEAGAGHLAPPRRLERLAGPGDPRSPPSRRPRSRSGATPRGRRRSGHPVSRRVLADRESANLRRSGLAVAAEVAQPAQGKGGTSVVLRGSGQRWARAGRRCSRRRRSSTASARAASRWRTPILRPGGSEERREHYRRVARIAERRNGSSKAWTSRRSTPNGPLAAPPRQPDRRRPPRNMSPSPTNAAGGPARPWQAQHRDSVFVVALAACAGYAKLPSDAGGGNSGRHHSFTGRVTRVVDGDTFWISSADERVRVSGSRCPRDGSARRLAGDGRARRTDLGRAADLPAARHRPLRPDRRPMLPLDGREITAAMIATGTARNSAATPAIITGPAERRSHPARVSSVQTSRSRSRTGSPWTTKASPSSTSRSPGRGFATSETRRSKRVVSDQSRAAAELGDRVRPPGDDADGDRLPVRRLPDRVPPEVRIGEQPVDEAGEGGHRSRRLPLSRTRPTTSSAPAPTASTATPIERVARGDVGDPLRGVVPVDLGAGGPGLARDLGEVEDAGELRLDLGARERVVAGDAEDRADEQAGAGDDVVGSGQRDRVAGLDVVPHRRRSFR